MDKITDNSCGGGGLSKRTRFLELHFTQLIRRELAPLSICDQVDLIKKVLRPYILNEFTDEGITIPPEFSEVWARCKAIIEKEVGR